VQTAIQLLVVCAAAHWGMDTAGEIAEVQRIEPLRIADGLMSGQTAWDPFFYLQLPREGLDVSDLPFLTVRMYSSADADVLDVYYRCDDGIWGLGRTLAIRRGWATYRADLRQTEWTEPGMPEDGRQWGGVKKRIVSFRLDPGNQEGRFIVVDQVSLTAEATGPLGTAPEPRGRIVSARVTCPRRVTAGEPVSASFAFRASAPGVARGLALIRLMSGPTLLQSDLREVVLGHDEVTVEHAFATSRYAFGGDLTVTADVLELDGDVPATAPCTVRNPRVGTTRPARAKVADYRGDPTLYLEGRPIPLITYLHHAGPHGDLHAQAASAGLKLYTDWFGSSIAGDLGQARPGEYDYGAFDAYFATVLERVPDAYFLPHIGVVAPAWWQQEHPEERALFSDGRRGPTSLFSQRWQDEMGRDLRRLIAHLRRAPYADRILGVLFYAGYTAEWQMWGTWQETCDDYSEPALEAFRGWLREQYPDDTALRAAWRDPAVTLDTAAIASSEERREPGPFLRDPAAGRRVIDLNRFNSEGTARAIAGFARVVKQATAGEWLAGTYYGYMAAHGARQQLCGHNALARVLECPDIDVLMSPNMYLHRELGGTSTLMSATESVKLHGKLWFDESDLRTYLSDPASGFGRTGTAEESVAVTWREFANVLTHRVAVGWFDMAGGWYSGAPMWDCYRQQTTVAERAFRRRAPVRAEVAVLVSETSSDYYRFSTLYQRMVGDTVANLPHVGVTWDCYLTSDLDGPELPDYKLYLVLNACDLSAHQRAALMRRAGASGATVLFLYAPGAASSGALTAEGITATTGMRVALASAGTPDYRLEPGAALCAGLDPAVERCPGPDLDPRPVITDPRATPVARYADDAGVALATKDVRGAHVAYCASVNVPADLLRNIARAAGVHVYIASGDSVYTDGQYLAVHAASDGEKTVTLPEARRIVDVRSGEVLARHADRVKRTMKLGETLFLELLD
jgi:hypothetical protein